MQAKPLGLPYAEEHKKKKNEDISRSIEVF